MKKLITIAALTSLFTISVSFAGSCLGENRCSSQLLRLEVTNEILSGDSAQNLLPALGNLARSSFLQNSIVKQYDIPTLPFPHRRDVCLREKESGNRRFRNVDCDARNLCERGAVDPRVREMVCIGLPCTIFEGSQNEGQCNRVEQIYAEKIEFPTPVKLSKIELNPTSIDLKDGQANICLSVDAIEAEVSTRLTLDRTGTEISNGSIEVNNVAVSLDGPRLVCASASIDLTSQNPISNLVITPQGNAPFISNQMIIDAAENANVEGLVGYHQEDIDIVKSQLLTVVFHPLRPDIEEGIIGALQEVFQEELDNLASAMGPSSGNQALYMDSSDVLGSLSISNARFESQLAILECAYLEVIPPNHSCIGETDSFGETITQSSQLDPSKTRLGFDLSTRGSNVNDIGFIDRLEALKVLIRNEPFVPSEGQIRLGGDIERWRSFHTRELARYEEDIDKFIGRIQQNSLRQSAISVIGLTDRVNAGSSRELSLITPELCETFNPSTHQGRSIPNCPAQVYVDLVEFNKVLEAGWSSGEICMAGRGVDRLLDSQSLPFGETRGCKMYLGGGLSCYLKSPPNMSYNSRTRRYDTRIELENCYKGPAGGIFGYLGRYLIPELGSLGSFRADFNIDLSSELATDRSGNIVAKNSRSKFKIVPGSGSEGLDENDPWNRQVTEGINEAFAGAFSEVISIPVNDMTNSMLGFPVNATGQIDKGPGYFGVCFTPERGTP